MADNATAGEDRTTRQHASRPLASLVRVLLAVAAAATLGAVTAVDGFDRDANWWAFVVLTLLGVLSRFLQRRSRGGPVPGSLIFVGSAVVVLDPVLALWCAVIVGLAGGFRGDLLPRVVVSASTLVLANAAGAWVRADGESWVTDQQQLGSGDDTVGAVTLLMVAVTLTLTWQVLRWIAAWIDRRAGSVAWRVHAEARWMRDVTFAGSAVILGAVWLAYPPLTLLVLIPLLSVWRFADGTALTGEPAVTDPLTDVGSAGMLRVALAEELARSQRFGRDLAVVVVDIDRMGRINQRFGQDAGDVVVQSVADRVRELARDYDVVARIGGDAFAVLLPEAGVEGARAAAERIRRAVAQQPVAVDTAADPIEVTVSVGVASFPSDADSHEGLLTEAELAANYARLEGGNRLHEAAALPAGFRSASTAGRVGEAAVARRSPTAEVEAVEAAADRAVMSAGPTLESSEHERLVRASNEAFEGAKPRTDRLLGLAGVSAIAASVVALWQLDGQVEFGRLALFAAIAVAAEWFAESIYGRSNSSWSAVPLIAIATAGAPGAELVIAAVAAGVGGGAIRGVRPRQAAFNSSVLVLSTLATAAAATATVDLIDEPVIAALFVGGTVGGIAFFLVDTWLVATAVGLATRTGIFEVWRGDLAWLVPHQLGMGVLGGAMAYTFVEVGESVTLVLVLPALGLHFAQRQFVGRTRDHVIRLRNLNDDLQHANTRIVRVNERLTDALEQVNNGYLVTVESLAAAVDAKDSYTGSHIDRVEAYGRKLLEVLDPELSDDDALLWGFRLHDVGKIGVPDSVLLKPGPLDDHEWELMKRHPEIGAQIVAAAPFLQGAREVILHHHERWDGRGYPFGLRETAIPFSARVFSCIDAFDAMTSDRPYRKAMPVDQAMQELLRHAGSQFDPEMVEAFLQIDADDVERTRLEVEQQRGGRARTGGLLLPIGPFEQVS